MVEIAKIGDVVQKTKNVVEESAVKNMTPVLQVSVDKHVKVKRLKSVSAMLDMKNTGL